MQTQVKNRIHALLAKEGIASPGSDLFGTRGRAFLRELELRSVHRLTLQQWETLLDVLEECIVESSIRLTQIAGEREEISRLLTIPGIGIYSALLLIAEISEIQRFPNPKKLCAYAGLVPNVYQSGQTRRLGHITKDECHEGSVQLN